MGKIKISREDAAMLEDAYEILFGTEWTEDATKGDGIKGMTQEAVDLVCRGGVNAHIAKKKVLLKHIQEILGRLRALVIEYEKISKDFNTLYQKLEIEKEDMTKSFTHKRPEPQSETIIAILNEIKNTYGSLYFKYEYSKAENFHYIIVCSREIYNNKQFILDRCKYQTKALNKNINNFGFVLASSKERDKV